MNPNYIAAYALIGRLKDHGVTHCVISPGSRSTPMAFVAHELLDTTIIIDERAAGFTALGISESTARPALVITTSGSGPTHLYPSIVEAHHSNVPVIVITADRPHEIRGVGAPQTIDQHNLYGRATNIFVDTICPHDQSDISYWEEIADNVISKIDISRTKPGVAHLNVGMREPLIPVGGEHEKYLENKSEVDLPLEEANDRISFPRLNLDKKILFTVGRNNHISFDVISKLAQKIKSPLLVDILSSNRNNSHEYVAHYDSIVRQADIDDLKPEMILQFGDPLTSKGFNQKMGGPHTVALKTFEDDSNPWLNQNETLVSRCFEEKISEITKSIGSYTNEAYYEKWMSAESNTKQKLSEMYRDYPESEPTIFQEICAELNTIPSKLSVLLASSMPVRYAEWFWDSLSEKTKVISHRGTNGIDGMLATSLGIAKGTKQPVISILGDVAFTHDVGFLPTLDRLLKNFGLSVTLIVINNSGGAIFNHLAQADSKILAPCYEEIIMTPPDLDIQKLCIGLDINYTKLKAVDVHSNIGVLLNDALKGLRIIEIEVQHNSGRDFMTNLNKVMA